MNTPPAERVVSGILPKGGKASSPEGTIQQSPGFRPPRGLRPGLRCAVPSALGSISGHLHQSSHSSMAGTAEPFHVAPAEAAVCLNAN